MNGCLISSVMLLPLLAVSSSLLLQQASCLQPQLLSENIGSQYSRLTSTKWRVRLDVGLQPGTWMPKRYPGWAESGARLVVDADIEFTDDRLPSNRKGESLIGPKEQTGILKVNHLGSSTWSGNSNNGINKYSNDKPYNPSTFVSEKGTQTVKFTDGGWCIQRPTADVRNAEGGKVQPGGILGFWLDCESGATRRDVEIVPKTRIFFTTGVWDDPAGLQALEEEYKVALGDLAAIEERTRDTRSKSKDDGKKQNLFEQLKDVRTMFVDANEYDKLKLRKELLERRSPPKSSVVAKNGVKMAPNGSLVIKGGNPNQPDWMPSTEYLILGTFSTKPLS
eukprot:CAMPEP_0168261254 /NCGR_PEP_ID=MMETSP0141_2-20121125/8957_1 /TAXON_ID=44445 /ORGANISM="Pseudo-nitzschia australis, Strain 10249 10 AB" /LENGTH=335 /DNA_ID=CAMNT_0008199343 /DNA_START=230 /DNA_END=1237 /DNA_ORIENTATION=-